MRSMAMASGGDRGAAAMGVWGSLPGPGTLRSKVLGMGMRSMAMASGGDRGAAAMGVWGSLPGPGTLRSKVLGDSSAQQSWQERAMPAMTLHWSAKDAKNAKEEEKASGLKPELLFAPFASFADDCSLRCLLKPTSQRTVAPGRALGSAVTRVRSAPPSPADRIMPSDRPKRILRGARLAMKTTFCPIRRSGSG